MLQEVFENERDALADSRSSLRLAAADKPFFVKAKHTETHALAADLKRDLGVIFLRSEAGRFPPTPAPAARPAKRLRFGRLKKTFTFLLHNTKRLVLSP